MRGARHVVLCSALLVACGPAAPPPRSAPPQPRAPTVAVGERASQTIVASRDFSFIPSGDALADLQSEAASRAPLHYTSAVGAEEAEAQTLRRVHTFETWVLILERNAKAKAAKLYKQHGTILGHPISAESFALARAASPRALIETFTAMCKGAIGPYRVANRSPVEDRFKGEKAIVHVEAGKGGKQTEVEIEPSRIKELREVRTELERIAGSAGAKLPKALQVDLVRIAVSGLTPTLSFDTERTRAARSAAAAKVKAMRVTYLQGQAILRQGEVCTVLHRQLIAAMRSRRCAPCAGGLSRCGPGHLRLLRVGSISNAPIRAIRDFSVAPGGAKAKEPATENTTRVFVCDEKAGEARAKTLKKLLELAKRLEGRARWDKLREGLQKELQVDVILQLLQSFGGVAFDKLRAALVELYEKSQATPLVAAKPLPRPGEACLVLRGKSEAAEESGGCEVVPLARFRLQLPERAAREPGLLSGLPAPARKAAIELVQQLLVANTRFDAEQTAQRAKGAAPQPKEGKKAPRFFSEGELVVPGGKRLTATDIGLLETMCSLQCEPATR